MQLARHLAWCLVHRVCSGHGRLLLFHSPIQALSNLCLIWASPQAYALPLGKLRLDEALALVLLRDFSKITSLLWASGGIKLETPWVSSDLSLESVFRFCGLKLGALACFHSVRVGVWVWASVWVVCVVVGRATGFWLAVSWARPWGCTHGAVYLRELSAPNCTQGTLGICLHPLWAPTHFTFVRAKLEESELPFLTSATPGTFLGQNRAKVTTKRRINPERQSHTFPPFDTNWHIPGPSPYSRGEETDRRAEI